MMPPVALLPIPIEITCVPAFAVSVGMTLPAPVQVVLALGVGAMMTPFVAEPGKISVKVTLSSWLVFVLVRVIVKVDMPSGLTVVGANALETDSPLTVNVAEKLPETFRL